MSKKIYVITKTSFSYNDEIYYSENEGGEPVVAYATKESADKALNLKIRDWFDGLESFTSYGYELDEVFDIDKFISLTGVSSEALELAWHDYSINNILIQHLDATIECCTLTPFKVTEIKLK